MSQQLGALQTHTTDTFLFISHTTNVLLFKFHYNIFIGVRIIKEMSGSVASGTRCISTRWRFVVILKPRFFYPVDGAARDHFVRGLVGIGGC